ncbi:MAG: hypothetical protein AVO33_05555 [delta proteobacterium ML8_F1]|nr:MAG: hypothetical protein AVO33_05555 [delta proteobacterium ML8_F1]
MKHFIVGLLLTVFILSSVVEIYAFNHGYYLEEFEKHQVAKRTDLSGEGIWYASERIIAYLKGDMDSLDISYEGVRVFNDKELAHMVDVKEIFNFMGLIKNLAVLLAVLIVATSKNIRILWLGLRDTLMISLVAGTALLFLISRDFTGAFIQFHEIFFSNELWLLDPGRDRLIQMLPEGFFMDMATAIVITYLSLVIPLGIFGQIKYRKS